MPDIDPLAAQLLAGDACRNAGRVETQHPSRGRHRYASDRGKHSHQCHIPPLPRQLSPQVKPFPFCRLESYKPDHTRQVHAPVQVQCRHRAALRPAQEGDPRSLHVDVSCGQHARQTRVTPASFFSSNPCAKTDREGVSSCAFFQWAEFDDDGRPPWATPLNTAPFTFSASPPPFSI